MKHTDWLRLQTEGENICSTLRQQDYQCLKQTRRLSWKVSKEGTSYLLTWLPAPVSDWSLIPNDTTPAREKLIRIIQSTLNTIMGLWIKQECEKFDYDKPVLEYLRRVWAKHSRLSERLTTRKRGNSLSDRSRLLQVQISLILNIGSKYNQAIVDPTSE